MVVATVSVRKTNQRKPIWFSFRAGLSEGLAQERRRGLEERKRGRERFLCVASGKKELHYQPISECWFGGRREEGKGVSYCPR